MSLPQFSASFTFTSAIDNVRLSSLTEQKRAFMLHKATAEVTSATGQWSLLHSLACSSLWRSGSALWPPQRSEFKVHSTTRVTYAHLTLICTGLFSDWWEESDYDQLFSSIMSSFTVNDRAKLVIIEETLSGKSLSCDIIMYDPFCFARVYWSLTVVGFLIRHKILNQSEM